MSRPFVVAGFAAVALLAVVPPEVVPSGHPPLAPMPPAAASALPRAPAAALVRAQTAPADGPGDDLNCDDFVGAGGFRAAQDNLLATWPEDPNGLDANANGIACENVDAFADAAEGADPAWVTLGLPAPGETPTPTPTVAPAAATTATATATATPAPTAPPQPTPPPVPAAPIAPTATAVPRPNPTPTPVPLPPVSYREALPAEVLARVDACASVAVSRRRLVATGCPDVGAVFWRQPRGEPNLKRTAIVRFVNPLDRNRPPRAAETPTPVPAP